MEEEFAEAAPGPIARGRHIKKRALKNKALSVSFNEKDLKDYVTGFHKRKKKRRKEAEKKQEEVLRRKRIEARKKRKLERESVYGEAPPSTGAEPDETDGDHDGNEMEPIASVAATTTYDNGNMTVTVKTSEISREEETSIGERRPSTMPKLAEANRKQNLSVSKSKSFKKVAKHKSKPRPLKKRDKKKGKKKESKGR